MQFSLRLELDFYHLPVSEGLRRLCQVPVVHDALVGTMRGVPRMDHEAVFCIQVNEAGMLRLLLATLLAYQRGGGFTYTPLPQHRYTQPELSKAEYLLMRVGDSCSAVGGMYRTPYDRRRYCPRCGAGAVVKEGLVLHRCNVDWVEEGLAFASRNEVFVTEDIIAVLHKSGIQGYRSMPVVAPRCPSRAWPGVRHIQFDRECGALPAENLVDPGERCPVYEREAPHRPGFWLLSPLCLRAEQVGGDLFVTRDHFGQFMGQVLPGPLMVVSQRVFRILSSAGAKGVTFEPVSLLDRGDDGLACGHEYDAHMSVPPISFLE